MSQSFRTGIFQYNTPVPQRIAGFKCPGVYSLIHTGEYTRAAEIMKESGIPFNQAYLFLSSYPEALVEYLRINAIDKNLPDKQRIIFANSYVTLYAPIILTYKEKPEYDQIKADFLAVLQTNQLITKYISKNIIVEALTQCNLLDILQEIYLLLQDWENYLKYFLEVQGTKKIPVSMWRQLTTYISKIPEMNIRQKIFKLFPKSQQKDLLRHWKELDLKRVLSVGADQSIRPVYPLLLDFVFEEPKDISLPEILQPIFEDLLIDRYHGLNSPQYATLYLAHLVRTENMTKLTDFFKTSTFNTGSQFFIQFWMNIRVHLLNSNINHEHLQHFKKIYFKKAIEPLRVPLDIQIEEDYTQTQTKRTKSVLDSQILGNIFSIFTSSKKNNKSDEEEDLDDDAGHDESEEDLPEIGHLKLEIKEDVEANQIDTNYHPIEIALRPIPSSTSRLSIKLEKSDESDNYEEDEIGEEKSVEYSSDTESEASELINPQDSQTSIKLDENENNEQNNTKNDETKADTDENSEKTEVKAEIPENPEIIQKPEETKPKQEETDKTQTENKKQDEKQNNEVKSETIKQDLVNIQSVINTDKKHKVRTEEEEKLHKEKVKMRKIAAKVSEHIDRSIYKPVLNYGIELNSHAASSYALSIHYAVNRSLIEKNLHPLILLIEGPLTERFKYDEDKSELKECWMRVISAVFELYSNAVRFRALTSIPAIAHLVRELAYNINNPKLLLARSWKDNITSIINDIEEVKFYNAMLKANIEQRKVFITTILSLDEENIKQGKFDKQFDELISKNEIVYSMVNDFKNCTGEETLVALYDYTIKQLTNGEKTKEMWVTSLEDLNPSQHRALHNLPSDARASLVYLIIKKSNVITDDNNFLKLFKQTIEGFSNQTKDSYDFVVSLSDSRKFILAQLLLPMRQQGLEASKFWPMAVQQFMDINYNNVKSIVKSTHDFEINSVQDACQKILKNQDLQAFKDNFKKDEEGYQLIMEFDETHVIELAKILDDKSLKSNSYDPSETWENIIKNRWKESIEELKRITVEKHRKLNDAITRFDFSVIKLIFNNLTSNIDEFKFHLQSHIKSMLHSINRIVKLDDNIIKTFLDKIRFTLGRPESDVWKEAIKQFVNDTAKEYTRVAQILLGYNPQLALDALSCFEKEAEEKKENSEGYDFKADLVGILKKRIEPLIVFKSVDVDISSMFGEIYRKNLTDKESRTVFGDSITEFNVYFKNKIHKPFKHIANYEEFIYTRTKELIYNDPANFRTNFQEFIKEITQPYNYVYAIDENLLQIIVTNLKLVPKETDPILKFKLPFRDLQKRLKNEMIPKVKKFADIPIKMVNDIVNLFKDINNFDVNFENYYMKTKEKLRGDLEPIKNLDPKFMKMFILLYMNPANPEKDVQKRWTAIVDGTINYLKERLLPFISKVKKIPEYAVLDLLEAMLKENKANLPIKTIVENTYMARSQRYFEIFEMHQDIINDFSSFMRMPQNKNMAWQQLCERYPDTVKAAIQSIEGLRELDEPTKEVIQGFIAKDGRSAPDNTRIFIDKLVKDLYALVGPFDPGYPVNFTGVSLDNGALNVLRYYINYDYPEKPDKLSRWNASVSMFGKTVVDIYESVAKHLQKFDARTVHMFLTYKRNDYTHDRFLDFVQTMVNDYKTLLTIGSNTLKRLETYVTVFKTEFKNDKQYRDKWDKVVKEFQRETYETYTGPSSIFTKLPSVPLSIQQRVIFYLEDVIFSMKSCFEQYSLSIKEHIFDMDPNIIHIVSTRFNELLSKEIHNKKQEMIDAQMNPSQSPQKTQQKAKLGKNKKQKVQEDDDNEQSVVIPPVVQSIERAHIMLDIPGITTSVWKKFLDDSQEDSLEKLTQNIINQVTPLSSDSSNAEKMQREDIVAIFDAVNPKLSIFKERLIAAAKDSKVARKIVGMDTAILMFLISIISKVASDKKLAIVKSINEKTLKEKRDAEFEARMREIKAQEMKQKAINLEMDLDVESTKMTERISFGKNIPTNDTAAVRKAVDEEIHLTEAETETKAQLSEDDKVWIWEQSIQKFLDFFQSKFFIQWKARITMLNVEQIARFTMPEIDAQTLSLISVLKDTRLLNRKLQVKPTDNIKKRLQKKWPKSIFKFLEYMFNPIVSSSKFTRFDVAAIVRWDQIFFDCSSGFINAMSGFKSATENFNETFSLIEEDSFQFLKESLKSLGYAMADKSETSPYDELFNFVKEVKSTCMNMAVAKRKDLKDSDNTKQKILLKDDIDFLEKLNEITDKMLDIKETKASLLDDETVPRSASSSTIKPPSEGNEENKERKHSRLQKKPASKTITPKAKESEKIKFTSPLEPTKADGSKEKLLKRFTLFICVSDSLRELKDHIASVNKRQEYLIADNKLKELTTKIENLINTVSSANPSIDHTTITRKMWQLALKHFENKSLAKIVDTKTKLLSFKDAAVVALCTNLVDNTSSIIKSEEKFKKNLPHLLEEYDSYVKAFEKSVIAITGNQHIPENQRKTNIIGLTAADCRMVAKEFMAKCMEGTFINRLYQQAFYRRFNIEKYEYFKRVLHALGDDRSSLKMLLHQFSIKKGSSLSDSQNLSYKYYGAVVDTFGRHAEWLISSHEEIREIDGYKQYVTIFEADDTWKELLSRAVTSKIIRLDDIMKFIPEKMEITFLNQSIIDSIKDFQDQSSTTEDKIQHLKERSVEQREAKNAGADDQHAIDVDSSELCEFCRQSLYTDRFIVFPCHHALHIHCLLENMDLFFEPHEQLNLIALQASAMKREDSRAKLIEKLSRSCPICGELSVEILNKSFAIEDEEQVQKWSLVPI